MKAQEQIIVSLTSFPARIEYAYLAIQCMLRQTYNNIKVILWLSRVQFPTESVPQNLEDLKKYGLEIRFVDDDIRSHKKHYYTFIEYPESLVFLIDDDIIYPSDIIEKSYMRFQELGGKKIVIGNYGRTIKRNKNGWLEKYATWEVCYFDKSSDDVFFGSGGGTLLRPSDLCIDKTQKDLFLKLTPTADDIWLNAMARLGSCDIKVFMENIPLLVDVKNNQKLADVNVYEGNDTQLRAIQEYYLSKLKKKIF